jgi:hypothetical protein
MPTQLAFNGIYADTGESALPPMSTEELAAIARASVDSGELADKRLVKDLQRRKKRDDDAADPTKGHLGPIEGVDPKDLAQAGWGVIFASDADPLLIESLRPLLDHRKAEASKIKPERYRELTGDQGYFPGDTKAAFLDNHGAGGGGAADPDQLPYYLLIVASPEVIPWSFQYQLDVQYAVGRLWFDDPGPGAPDRYAPFTRYAVSVVQAETGAVALPKRAIFFGTSHGDLATALSATELVAPLSRKMKDDQPTWTVTTLSPADSTKVRLTKLLGGDETPAVLFTATHGMLFRPTDPLQAAKMGALLCGEYQGAGPVADTCYFSGGDLPSDAHLAGLISFHFACFGAGVPQTDDYSPPAGAKPPAIAPRPFVASLPQRLLSHSNGGALAVVAHIDRAWGYSFKSENGDTQLRTFKDALKRLMEGHPIGSALEPFNQRYAELSSDLVLTVFNPPDADEMAFLWTSNNDARNYVVLGDPAVRLQLATDPASTKREISMPIEVKTPTAPVSKPVAAAVDYGLLSDMTDSLQDLTKKIVGKLGEAVNALATVEVSTYTTSDMNAAKTSGMQTATLRAYSKVRLDGNAELCVPETNGQVDEALWKIHSDMVQKALDNRTAMLKAIASAVSSLKP